MEIQYTVNMQINSLLDLQKYRLIVEENNMHKPNFSKLARDLGKSRNTIKKYYYDETGEERKKKHSKIDKFHDIIKELLSADNIKRFDYIIHLYDYLVDKYDNEVDFKYGAFRLYIINNFNDEFKHQKSYSTGARFETLPGCQMQFDLKESQTLYDNNNQDIKIDIACSTLGYSRFTYRELLPDKTTDSIINYFVNYFEFLGGAPKEMVIDNLKALVSKPRSENCSAILNAKFEQFCKDFNIKVNVCMPYRPQTKGKVEVQMKPIDAIHNYNGDFSGLAGVNDIVDKIDKRTNARLSQATGVPPVILLSKEKEHLNPLPPSEICSKYKILTKSYKVGNDSMFSFKSNRYSLPINYQNKRVDVRITDDQLQVYDNTKLVCIHQISEKKLNYLEEHHLQVSQSITKKDIKEQALENFKKMGEINYVW